MRSRIDPSNRKIFSLQTTTTATATANTTITNMKPLDVSDTDDEQETLSFLPNAPMITVRVPRRKKQKKSYCCRPWMFQSFLLASMLACVIGVKLFLVAQQNNQSKQQHITKWRDLNLADIHHWCLQPNVTSCKCANPLQPTHRHGHKTWTEAHHENIKLAKNNMPKKTPFRELDVVFLGDSITEGWRGTSFGQQVEKKEANVHVFEELFDMDKGGELDGLVLGIAGDKSQNLLWRIQNGEVPRKLKSKVFWVLIGTNDFLKEGLDQCSDEVVLMGIERIVEELMVIRPASTIVINGLLPRAIGNEHGKIYQRGKHTVMDAIDTVNKHLKEFCDHHDDLEYFDPKEIFVGTDPTLGSGRFAEYIPEKLMYDRLHPTALGYRLWGNIIVEELRSILNGKLTVER